MDWMYVISTYNKDANRVYYYPREVTVSQGDTCTFHLNAPDHLLSVEIWDGNTRLQTFDGIQAGSQRQSKPLEAGGAYSFKFQVTNQQTGKTHEVDPHPQVEPPGNAETGLGSDTGS